MRILFTMLILLFAGGCASEKASKQKDSLTGAYLNAIEKNTNREGEHTAAKTDDVKKTIIADDPLAGIDLNDVYNNFITYVKDVQEKYKNDDIQAEQLGWIKPKDIDRYLTLRPVELLWASTVILVVAQERDIDSESRGYTKWGTIMEKQGAKWVPQGAPRIVYIYSGKFFHGRREKLINTELVFSPEENYDPIFDLFKWNYTWPHDLLPTSFNNAEIISSPVESHVNNKGKTKTNWGKPVIIRTSNDTEIEITCNKYQESLSEEKRYSLDYKPISIEGKKAWIGYSNNKENEFTIIQFFDGEVLFKIQQNGKYNQNDCFDIIKQITEFMQPAVQNPLKIDPSMSPEEVNAQIAGLRKFIIPPKGVSKADVDAVFGVAEIITESTGKGNYMYPLHKVQLLEPKPHQQFRAFLYVSYTDDRVSDVGIDHYCVARGRAFYDKEAIERENKLVLEDLIEIQKKYGSKLKDASWNKQLP